MLKFSHQILLLGALTGLVLSGCDGSNDRFMAPSEDYQSSGDAVVGGGTSGNQNPGNGSTLLVTYQAVVKPAIDNGCVGCHNEEGAAPQLVLQTYDQVVGAIGPALARLGNDANPMPPEGAPAARANLAQTLRAWQDQGFPE